MPPRLLANGKTKVGLVSVDVVLLPSAVTRTLEEQVSPSLALTELVAFATHTHSAFGGFDRRWAGARLGMGRYRASWCHPRVRVWSARPQAPGPTPRGKPVTSRDVSDHRQPSLTRCPNPLPDMNSTVNLTDLQLAIVRILWERGECTVLEVQEALAPERKLAQTTVATILTRLEKRKIVRHQAKGRLFVYKALVTEPQVRRSMVSDLTALLFDGSPAALINHLLSEKEIKASDLDEVKRLIADAERGDSDVAR